MFWITFGPPAVVYLFRFRHSICVVVNIIIPVTRRVKENTRFVGKL